MSSRLSSEEKPFLDGEEAGSRSEDGSHHGQKRRSSFSRSRFHVPLAIVHAVFLILNISLFIYNFTGSRIRSEHDINSNMAGMTISPARHVLQYKIQEAHKMKKSSFVGDPRPEIDQAWSHLLRSSMIRLTEDELRSMNKTSIPLRDGSGYIGYIEGIHMLHCVKRMYQYQHQGHYPELKGTDAFMPGHWDHCLEVLREGIMCNADVTVNTYGWKGDDDIKGDRSGPRKCTDWSRVQSWLGERAIEFHDKEEFLSRLVRKDEQGSVWPVYS